MAKWNIYSACMTLLVINKISINASHDIEVSLNDSAYIGCSPKVPMDIQWHHTGHMKPRVLFYAGRNFYPPYKGRFQIDQTDNCSLLIPSVNSTDAGLYQCSEEISGRPLNSVHLTVLGSIPVCGSNMKSQDYVGPSTCNLEQDDMTFTCAVSFNGKPPQMIWTTLNDSEAFNESTCKTENGRINCSLILKADPMYDGSIFTCQSTKSSANCSTDIKKIQYYESDSKLVVEKNISDKVNCSAKSNQILQFTWTQFLGNQYVTLVKNQTLLISSPGFYRCIVEYRIRNAKCSALGTEVFVSKPSINHSETGKSTAATTVLSIIVAICVPGIIIITFLLCRVQVKKIKRRMKNEDIEALKSLLKDTLDGGDESENNLHIIDDIIDVDFGLIDRLRAKSVLNRREILDIQAINAPIIRNSQLLDKISRKKNSPELCDALDYTGQKHIANYLKAYGVYDEKFADEWPLTETENRSIDSNYEVLVELIDNGALFQMLYESEVFNKRQREFISLKETSYKRNEAFLEILRKKSLRAYKETILCLRKSNWNRIAKILETGEDEKQEDMKQQLAESRMHREDAKYAFHNASLGQKKEKEFDDKSRMDWEKEKEKLIQSLHMSQMDLKKEKDSREKSRMEWEQEKEKLIRYLLGLWKDILVPVNETLKTDNLNETDTQLVGEVTNLLKQIDVSAEQANRFLSKLLLKNFALLDDR